MQRQTSLAASSTSPLLTEGIVFQYKGILKGFTPYYAKLLEPDIFVLHKKTYDGRVSVKLKLEYKKV